MRVQRAGKQRLQPPRRKQSPARLRPLGRLPNALSAQRAKSPKSFKRRRGTRTVFSVRDRKTGKLNVVKRYSNHLDARHELKVIRSLPTHPNLVRFKRYYVRNGAGYIVMEKAPGISVEKLAQRRRLPPETVARIALGILEGLVALHRSNYVHGDLHPGNVIVSNVTRPKVKIIDFQHTVRKGKSGRAKARRILSHPPRKLAPECRTGKLSDSFDIYGVGYICAVLLTGRSPSRAAIDKAAKAAPDSIWSVIAKATRRRPKKRYASALEMMEALRASMASPVSPEP